jgi:hypothetical protein
MALMPQLDISAALAFLDMLDAGGRHTLASEAPFGGASGGPRWEIGGTYEALQRKDLIEDIQKRQARGSNVYYGVNRPCPVGQQQGWKGKCNVDDIIAIRALAFDIDIIKRPFDTKSLLTFIDRELIGALRPSLLINTGGGFHLIYLLDKPISVELSRPTTNDDEQAKANRYAITRLAYEFESLLRSHIPSSLKDEIKIDNMSNVDRVMRLPGTVNYPKEEKRARGQVEALAHIEIDYQCRCDIFALRKNVPRGPEAPAVRAKPNVIKINPRWPNIRKVRIACNFIRDKIPEVDVNSWYTYNVMFPLISAIHDPVDPISEDEAFECFMEAVSGGARYGIMGRGPGFFHRQWESHHPELPPRVSKTRELGTLFGVCKKHGMQLPWIDSVIWDDDFERQRKEISETKQVIDPKLWEEISEILGEK